MKTDVYPSHHVSQLHKAAGAQGMGELTYERKAAKPVATRAVGGRRGRQPTLYGKTVKDGPPRFVEYPSQAAGQCMRICDRCISFSYEVEVWR